MDKESSTLKLLGATLQLVSRNGATRVFVTFVLILAVFCTAFSFRINPYLAFFVFIVIFLLLITFLCILIIWKPELLLDSKTWFGYQKFQHEIGDKRAGLSLPSPEAELVQPIIVSSEVKSEITGKPKTIRKEGK